jgi:diadenosine tetraphosphate (Ap4A) HIT family hydrolase
MKNSSCPFCNRILLKGNVIQEGDKWFLIESYKPIISPHLILIPVRHIRTIAELHINEMKEYVIMLKFAFKKIKKDPIIYINGKKGQSVKHLHIHLFPNTFEPFEIENLFRKHLKEV